MEKVITFIVRVKNNYNAACRCINSIKRQTVDNYNIILLVYTQEIVQQLELTYSEYEIYLVKDNRGFRNKVNALIPNINTEYSMFVDSDSILACNAFETILSHNSDVIIFNFSKSNAHGRFEPFYLKSRLTDIGTYMEQTQSIWAVAFRTELVKKYNIKLKGIQYQKQALFLLMCMALAETVSFEHKVLLYKWIVTERIPIEREFYKENEESIKLAMQGFKKKGDKSARAQLIKNFLIAEIEASYELPFFARIKRAIPVIKLMWF